MKTFITGIPILLFVFQFAIAQENKNKMDVAIQGGLSLPIGRFANKDFIHTFDKPNGLAKNGYVINAALYYRHRNKYGFSLLLGYSSNELDLSDFAKGSRPNFYSNISKTDIIEKKWKIYKALLGAYFEVPLSSGSKFSLRPALYAGLCKTDKPEYRVDYFDPQGNFLANSRSFKISLPLSFCFQADINLSYTINKKIYALLDVNFFYANPVHKFSHQNTSNNTVTSRTKYNLSSLNIMMGIGIKL